MLAGVRQFSDGYRRFLSRWVAAVASHATMVTVLAIGLSGILLFILIDQIEVNTDTEDMLSADLPFRQNSIALSKAFPQLSDDIVIVLDARNPDLLDDGATALVAELRRQPELFGDVFYPAEAPYFRQNGLLFLDREELTNVVDRLSAAQPFLGTLWRDPSLSALLNLLQLSLTQSPTGSSDDLLATARAMTAIADVIKAQAEGRRQNLAWQTLMTGQKLDADDLRRFVIVQPKLDFGSLQPGEEATDALREIAVKLKLTSQYGIRMRLTGSVPLADEELSSVVNGLGLAGVLSLSLVFLLLIWGLRSAKLVAATLITLIAGLIWTATFATLAVGALNLISVAFAVLFIGLSVDFGIHFALRYKEFCGAGNETKSALAEAAKSVGGPITLTAVAAAIGFYSFLPTDYRGLAELGAIAGSGMFIALIANLTLLPALLALMPITPPKPSTQPNKNWQIFARHPRPIIWASGLVAIAAVALTPQARFDFDPLNLKDPNAESVATVFDLISDPQASPYVIKVLAKDQTRAEKLGAALIKSPLVKGTATIKDLVPVDQVAKLEIIDDAALILSAVFTAPGDPGSTSITKKKAAIESFTKSLDIFDRNDAGNPAVRQAFDALKSALTTFAGSAAYTDQGVLKLERRLLSTLPGRLRSLRDALDARAVTVADVPATLRQREVAADGRVRLQVFPKEDIRDRNALVRFVAAVRMVAPSATGAPVIILEAGKTVVRSFTEAAVITGIAITLLLSLLFGRLRNLLLVYAPLGLAALLTVAASVLLNLPFNFANVIVLPLLFGLGVASSIHLIARATDTGDDDVFETSTPRAVIFSAFTTIGSFGSIAFSSHPGTASMGILLTVALALTLISTLIVLPALMQLWPPRPRP